MKRKLLTMTLAAFASLLSAATEEALANRAPVRSGDVPTPYVQEVVPVPRYHDGRAPQIDVWTRRGDGAVLRPGQRVNVFFRIRRDAFVIVYNVDTRGRVRLLFPRAPHDDGWVQGRTTVGIPDPRAGYELKVTGPPGVERIVALASNQPMVHRWRDFVDADLARNAGWDVGPNRRIVGQVVQTSSGNGKPELRRAPVRPNLVPVPVTRRGQIRRDETWFEVTRPRWRDRHGVRRYWHGDDDDDDWH